MLRLKLGGPKHLSYTKNTTFPRCALTGRRTSGFLSARARATKSHAKRRLYSALPRAEQGTQTKLLTLKKLLFPHFSALSCHSTWTSHIQLRSSPPPAFLSHPPHPPSTPPLLHVGFSSHHGNENRGPNWHVKLGAGWLLARFWGEGAALIR